MNRIIFLAVAATMFFQHSAYAGGTGWNIDETCRFQLVYLPPEGEGASLASAPGDRFMEPLLKNIPAYRPDIDNILYKNILGLGFPLPGREDASKLKLYLKLYEWPAPLDPVLSSHRIFDALLLYKVAGAERLYESSKNPANVYVKYASIDRANRAFTDRSPFRAPEVPKQWQFDSHLPFSSLYVTPEQIAREGTEADRARASARGVVAFHGSLARVYEASLSLLAATEEKRYFADFRRCPDSADGICAVRIYEVPVKPFVFDNFRDLPMPQDPDRVFLSGLLLVKLTDYVVDSPMTVKEMEKMRPGTKAFDTRFRAVWSHVFEVASVLDLR